MLRWILFDAILAIVVSGLGTIMLIKGDTTNGLLTLIVSVQIVTPGMIAFYMRRE